MSLRDALNDVVTKITWRSDHTAIVHDSEALNTLIGWVVKETSGDATNAVYADRNLIVQAFASAMEGLGYHVAWGVDESEPDWPVLYIETAEGQVSWHVPKAERIYEPEDRTDSFGPMVWDGHTDAEKFARLRRLISPPVDREDPA